MLFCARETGTGRVGACSHKKPHERVAGVLCSHPFRLFEGRLGQCPTAVSDVWGPLRCAGDYRRTAG